MNEPKLTTEIQIPLSAIETGIILLDCALLVKNPNYDRNTLLEKLGSIQDIEQVMCMNEKLHEWKKELKPFTDGNQ